jgi:hypothetical protein
MLAASQFTMAFEYSQRQRHGLSLTLKSKSPVTTRTTRLILCAEDASFRIKRIRLRPINADRFQSRLPSIALTSKGCFALGNLKFTSTGTWEMAIWNQHDELATLPIVVAAKKFTLLDEIKRPAVQVWVSNSHKNDQSEAWLFCGKRLVDQVYLFHPESNTRLFRRRLKDHGQHCRIFNKLPLPHKGHWQLITVLDNGEKVFGKVIYH